MTETLLQTKLGIPPTRSSLVSRPHLHNKLHTGLWQGAFFARKLTLVSAPAGFGKTTLVANWLRSSNFPGPQPQCCWLSLDQYDDDPNLFWQYVLAALNGAAPHIGATTRPLLSSSPLSSPPALLTELLNELHNLPHPIVLVLDDYHHIADRSIHQAIDFLLDHAPPQLHLVLITRADPPLGLARLRGRGLLQEVRAADLRFTLTETAVFLREVMDLPLSAEDISALDARTEGWITGLHLTGVSLQHRTDRHVFIKHFTGNHHFILEYLTEEVLQQQPEEVQTFLLQTSILSQLSGPLCAAVTGRGDCQAVLRQLHRQNLFITPLDNDGHWFRVHHLLAELLGQRLRQLVSAAEIKKLHHRASLWWAEQGVWETAVTHAIAAEDWERAANLVARTYPGLLAQGRIAAWQRWLAQIPAPFIEARPALLARRAWATFLRGELQQAEEMLVTARQSLQDAAPSPDLPALRGELATYLATISFFREEPARVIQAAEEALTYLPPEPSSARARATSALGMGFSLAGNTRRAMQLFHETAALARAADNPFFLAHGLELVADGQFHTGQLRAAAATCREIIALGAKDRAAPLPFAANGHLKLAAVYVEWRELRQAEEEMAAGIALSRQGGIGYNLVADLCTQVRLHHALGNKEEALTALRQAEAAYSQNPSRFAAVQLAACAVQYWLHAGDVATAVSWAEGFLLAGVPITPAEMPIISWEVQQVSLARVRLAQERPNEVLAIYDPLTRQAEAAGRLARVIEIGLLGALALQLKGEMTAALETLQSILQLTEPEGYVQIFAEAGRPMLALLEQLPTIAQTAYVQQLLHAVSASLQLPSAALVEPLSPRELEVLRLIAAGLSNRQITVELTVSLNTVKKHTTHIYGKLGVNGRTQAIARARELHLI